MATLKEDLREFCESEEYGLMQNKWISQVMHFFEDGKLCGISLIWIDKKLEECDYTTLYQRIIRSFERDIERQVVLYEDLDLLKERLRINKQMFYQELSEMIYHYCI